MKADVAKPSPPSSWTDLIPEHEKDVLKGAVALKGDSLVTRYGGSLVNVQAALNLVALQLWHGW